jgi:hypothetical protein
MRKQCFKILVKDVYEAIYDVLSCPMTKRGPILSKLDNIQIVALKRVAEKLYNDAMSATRIIDKRTQMSEEDLAKNSQ